MRFATWSTSRFTGWPAALAILGLLLGGCVSVAFEGAEYAMRVSPEEVAARGAPSRGTVVWGGRIVAVKNLEEGTEFQVLAVPLDGGNVPMGGVPSQGRFVAFYPGFLEPEDYAPGRFVSLAGRLDGFVEGEVGERPMTFPYVRTAQVHLWPRDVGDWRSPSRSRDHAQAAN